ncbi:MAG: hypothetical protein WCX97_05555, partial [Candidatus Magasanikbacteria bacterium]
KYDGSVWAYVREERITSAEYNYSYEKNKQDNGTPIAHFRISVWAVNDIGLESTRGTTLEVWNQAPNIVDGLTNDFTGKDCVIWWNRTQEQDIDHYKLNITGTGGTFTYLIPGSNTDFVYTYDQNVNDNGTPGDPSLTLNFYVVDAFEQISPVYTLAMINPIPGAIGGLTASPSFRAVYFEWNHSVEQDHKNYSIRTMIGGGLWSDWQDIASNWYNRVLSSGEIGTYTVSGTVYGEVKDKDIFNQLSTVAASANGNAEDIKQVDLNSETFQVIFSDSDNNFQTTLKILGDGHLSSGGIFYTV